MGCLGSKSLTDRASDFEAVYKQIALLGRGSFGDVVEAEHLKTGFVCVQTKRPSCLLPVLLVWLAKEADAVISTRNIHACARREAVCCQEDEDYRQEPQNG